MFRFSVRAAAAVTLLAVGVQSAVFAAGIPSESLLPNTTKGFLSISDVDRLKDAWGKTQLGQLMADESMKPFTDDVTAQAKHTWAKAQHRLGVSLEDLDGVPGGEACVAVVEPSANTGAMLMVIDVTGRIEQANAMLAKMAANMKAEKAQKGTGPRPEITVYTLPLEDGEKTPRVTACFLKDNTVAMSDNVALLDGVYARLSGKTDDSLQNQAAFKFIMHRCEEGSQSVAPQVRWFIEPFGYIETMRALNPPREKRRGTDPVKVFRNQGFTALQGAGGYVTFAAEMTGGKYELLHRSAIYAPGKKDNPEKYELAARMLKFPNGGDFLPQSFVPRELCTFTTVNWDIKSGFQNAKSLIDGLAGQEVIEDILKGLKDDPLGPQIDVEKDLVGNLGGHITVLSDYQLPITPKSERIVVAAETTNEAIVAATIAKDMETDPTARKLEFEGHVIWEIVAEADTQMAPVVTVPGAKAAAAEPEPDKGALPNSAVSVAFGHMFISSHVDFLKKVLHEGALAQAGSTDGLANSIDFRLVQDEVKKVGISETSLRTFSRTDEEFRVTYELIRNGQMPESESLLGQILNKLLGEGKEGVLRKQRIDGKNLPEYDIVRRYLGPAGAFMTSEDDGWYVVGFMLNKEAPAPPLADANPATGSTQQ